ncbi:hypothetical protein [Mesorhizobium sp. B2-3-12]|uniref:hypothetical protein n=1 Tax=Mesorhizobium sp. B2-3-12 TaxID=2589952 RepID=UPI0032B1C8A4
MVDPQFADTIEKLGIAKIAKLDAIDPNLNASLRADILEGLEPADEFSCFSGLRSSIVCNPQFTNSQTDVNWNSQNVPALHVPRFEALSLTEASAKASPPAAHPWQC